MLRGILYGTVSGSTLSDSIYSNVYEHLGWIRQHIHYNRGVGRGFSFTQSYYAGSAGAQPFGSATRGTIFGDIDRDGKADAMSVYDNELQFARTAQSYWPTLNAQPSFAFYGSVER